MEKPIIRQIRGMGGAPTITLHIFFKHNGVITKEIFQIEEDQIELIRYNLSTQGLATHYFILPIIDGLIFINKNSFVKANILFDYIFSIPEIKNEEINRGSAENLDVEPDEEMLILCLSRGGNDELEDKIYISDQSDCTSPLFVANQMRSHEDACPIIVFKDEDNEDVFINSTMIPFAKYSLSNTDEDGDEIDVTSFYLSFILGDDMGDTERELLMMDYTNEAKKLSFLLDNFSC